MKIKILSAALGLALIAGALNANAQKVYTTGVVSYPTEVRGQPADAKEYFTPDSSSTVVTFGPGSLKFLTNAKHDYYAVLVDIPIAGIKKAGIATPAELEEGAAAFPTLTFSITPDSKVISGFNCTKSVAKDSKTGKTYDIWITNDVKLPDTAMPFYYKGIGGFPIQYVYFFQGQEQTITVKSITDEKAPAGTFGIASDFEKGTMADLMAGQ